MVLERRCYLSSEDGEKGRLCHPMASASRLNRNMGKLLSLTLKIARVRIAYRPAAGFAGDDKFTLHNQVRGQDVTYLVSVQR